MSLSAARAGLLRRSIAFAVDLFTVSVIISLGGVWLAGATGGSVRVGGIIGSRIRCALEREAPAALELPPDTKVDQVARCTKEILGVPYDWSLDVRARIKESVNVSSARVVTVPLHPTGHVTDTFYLDSSGILLFGIYAFLAEWQFGTTLGKRLLGLRVRALTGGPLDCRRAAKRAMMRVAAFVPDMVVTALTTGSVAFALWLFEHPTAKIIGGVLVAFWLMAFAANFIIATTRRALPWHDQWSGTEAVPRRNDRKLRDTGNLPPRLPVPSWLVRGRERGEGHVR